MILFDPALTPELVAAEAGAMPDSTSLALFAAATLAIGALVVTLLPRPLRSLRLALAVTSLSLIGPAIALASVLTGAGFMALSGHAVGQLLIIAGVSALTAVAVSIRLTRPIASDLDALSAAIDRIAGGDHNVTVGVHRSDEIGTVATAINELSRKLQRAEKARDLAEKERTAVVCSLSHDLRTPLASLLASVDAMEDGIGSEHQHRAVVRRNITTMNQLVEDLFLLARAEAGAQRLQVENHDLAELVDEALEALQPAAAAKAVTLSSDAHHRAPTLCDAEAMGRVLRNVLDNAIRYTPASGTVSVALRSEAGRRIVTVRDEGPGFPEDFAAHAFERFSQADPSRSSHGGAGLGLAISQSLIHAQHGTIAVEPGPHGCIEIALPIASVHPLIGSATTNR